MEELTDTVHTTASHMLFSQKLNQILEAKEGELVRVVPLGIRQPRMDGVKVVFTYQENPKKREVQDFVTFFKNRYFSLEKILRQRQELSGVLSVSRVLTKRDREHVAVIGIVTDKTITKNKHMILKIEDPTGEIKILINNKYIELFALGNDIVLDEVIGIIGIYSDKWIMANNILFPDIPRNKELKKSPESGSALFISDLHIGSKDFLEDQFVKMLKWIGGDVGSESQREISSNIKYIFVGGDLVDGIGIYQNQEETLTIKDIFKQYERCADFFSMIPEHIPIIMCPGNHDALRITEPQPALYKDFSKPMWDLKNIYLVSNPNVVNIGASDTFPGFDVLTYHGYSFDYYAANVNSIRQNGAYDRADLIMRFLLQRRHLAPTHTSTQYLPDTRKDPLIIEQVPDFFLTGHVHRSSVSMYRNITMVNGSCWQGTTAFQEKMGHNVEPCRVFAMDLVSRAVKILRF